MPENAIRFSDVPRLRSDELENEYPVTDYMQWKKKLNQQREIIKIVESTLILRAMIFVLKYTGKCND